MLQPVNSLKRFANALIDVLVIKFAILPLCNYLLLFFNPTFFDQYTDKSNINSFLTIQWCACILIYYVPMEFLTGRTIGKLITNTKVISEDGKKPNLGSILSRNFIRLIPLIDALSFLGATSKGFHDSISETLVVNYKTQYVKKHVERIVESEKSTKKPSFIHLWSLRMGGFKIGNLTQRGKFIIIGIFALLVLTNPSVRSFKEYLGYEGYRGLSRKYNFFVFSIYERGHTPYFGMCGNFIEIGG